MNDSSLFFPARTRRTPWLPGWFLILSVLLISVLLMPAPISAQSGLDARDLSRLRADQITDAQLVLFLNRAEAEGYTADEALELARMRGLPASQVQELRQRIRELDPDRMPDPEEDLMRDLMEETDEPEPEEPDRYRRPERIETLEERRVFGSRIFREERESFTPSMQVPTPASYTLGPGDELVAIIWGETSNIHRLPVSREGTVTIDNLGPVFVSGLTISEASDRIINQLRNLYSGLRPGTGRQTTYAQVSLERMRTIQVSVVGEVHNPGSYELGSLATVFNALYRSGGPHFKGSYRSIRIFRENEKIALLDLYEFLVDGNQESNIRLRDQDVIMVDPYGQRVDLRGEMKRTGLFEFRDGETLEDLLRFSGGFNEHAYTRMLRVYRNTPVERRIESVHDDWFGRFTMQGGDMVFVDRILDRFENRVTATGAFWREGEYELTADMTLLDLIESADGLRPDAFLTRGVINRLRDDLTLEQVAFNPGRLLAEPDRFNLPLQPEDEVVIRSIHDMREMRSVAIHGAIRQGGSFDFREGMTLEDLILKAEGFREEASEARIEISRRIPGEAAPGERGTRLAETFTFGVNRDLQVEDDAAGFELRPFDRIFVHSRPEYAAQRTVRIEGEVLYPGTYTLRDRTERISSLIERAGGLTDEAYIPGARLTRRVSAIDRADIRFDFLPPDEVLFDTLDSDTDSDDRDDAAQRDREIRRIGIDLRAILDNPQSSANLHLMEGDILRIPQELETVRVAGAVMQEVEVRFRPGMSLREYVDLAGGYTENARSRRAYVVYANGDLDRRKRYFFGLVTTTPSIEPGAEIIIPERPERDGMSTGEVIAVSSTVVSMLATLTIALDRLSR